MALRLNPPPEADRENDTMSNSSNLQRAVVISRKTAGGDPGAIVGEGNILPSESNINAWSGIPSQPDRAPEVQMRELNWSDKAAPSPLKEPGARGYNRQGNPVAGEA